MPHLFFCYSEIGMRRQSVVMHFCNGRMFFKKAGDGNRIGAVTLHTHFQCFHAIDKQKSIERIAVTTEQPVRFGCFRFHEFYIAAEKNPADSSSMSVKKFCSGMDDIIHAKTEGLLQVRGGKC